MKNLSIVLLLLLVSLILKSQNTTSHRDSIYYEDYKIEEVENRYAVFDINKSVIATHLTGSYIYFDTNGWSTKLNLKKGLLVGEFERYSSTFKGPLLNQTVSFKKGYKEGIETFYSSDWNDSIQDFDIIISQIKDYKKGIVRSHKLYHSNGQLSGVFNFDKKGNTSGRYVGYYPNGIVSTEGQYENGNLVGVWKYFDSEGILTQIQTKSNDGVRVHSADYFPNGDVQKIQNLDGSVYVDEYIRYNEQGDTIEYHFYKEGIESGYNLNIYKPYYEDAYVTRYYTNDQGQLMGRFIRYKVENKQLMVEGLLDKEGKQDGKWDYYDDNGEIYKSIEFKGGCPLDSLLLNDSKFKQMSVYNLELFLKSFPRKKQVYEVPMFLFSE